MTNIESEGGAFRASVRGRDESLSRLEWLHWLPAVLLLLGCLYATLLCSSGPDVSGHAVGTDDSYITYRYAKNWVSGHGLVFNAGERVEGFSNPLYVLLMTVPFLIGVDVFHFSVVLNTVCVLLTLLLLQSHLQRLFDARTALFGSLLFAASPSIWIWASSGMETPTVLVLQVAIWVLVERVASRETRRDVVLLCAVIALQVLARADGFITGGLAAAYLFITGRRKLAIACGAAMLTTLGLMFAARVWYYGEIWPNTYYAKVTTSIPRRVLAALRQMGGVTSRHGVLPYLLALAFTVALLARRALSDFRGELERLRFGVFFSVLWIGYWFYIGGDNFEDRFLLVLIPITIPLLFELLPTERMAQGFVFALALAAQLTPIVRDDRYGKQLRAKYDYRIFIAHWVADNFPKNAVLATPEAGKIPFITELKTIDMLGLCDKHIGRIVPKSFVPGHSKEDPEYVFGLKPDLFVSAFYGDGLAIGEGMSAERYRSAGYRIRAVFNLQAQDRGERNVIDVVGKPDMEIALLAHSGWNGVVLDRPR